MFRIVTGLTGALIAIESIIVFIGVRFVANEGEQWICLKNDLLLVVDVVIGVGLIASALMSMRMSGLPSTTIFYALIIIALVSHGYREWECLTGVENRFFFNRPLFVFNNIRLLGLVVVALLAILETPNN